MLHIPTDIVFALFSLYWADTKFKINFSGDTVLHCSGHFVGFLKILFLSLSMQLSLRKWKESHVSRRGEGVVGDRGGG